MASVVNAKRSFSVGGWVELAGRGRANLASAFGVAGFDRLGGGRQMFSDSCLLSSSSCEAPHCVSLFIIHYSLSAAPLLMHAYYLNSEKSW